MMRSVRDGPPLREVRLAHGLSLRETARRVRIDPAHLSRIERGQAAPSVNVLIRLGRLLHIEPLTRLLAFYETEGNGSRDGQVEGVKPPE